MLSDIRIVVKMFRLEGDVVLTLCLSVWRDRISACMGASRSGYLQYSAQVAGHPSYEVCRRFLRGGQMRWLESAYYVAGFWVRPETIEHAMNCLARLIRLLLGDDAIAKEKMECGMSLTILGS